MSQSSSELARNVLTELSQDRVWFVRLRAIVSLGKQSDARVIPLLVRGLSDANRLVRFRAAEALVGLRTEMLPIFEQVVALQDRYGLHAYVTALENAGSKEKLEFELQADTRMSQLQKDDLSGVLETGTLRTAEMATMETVPKSGAGLL